MSVSKVETRWIDTDGGPLLLVAAAQRGSWRGSFVPGTEGDFTIETANGTFAFRTDYNFENPRTDYERACAIAGLVGELAVAGTRALVLDDYPLETTWRPLDDGGFFARKVTVEPDADVDAELAALPGPATWTDAGIVIAGGDYWLLDALDHGEQPEREPIAVHLRDGQHRILTANVTTGGVCWVCIRLARTQ